MEPKFFNSSTFWVLSLWGPLQNDGHKMAAGSIVFRDNLISAIPADVTDITLSQTAGSSAAALSVVLAGDLLTSRK